MEQQQNATNKPSTKKNAASRVPPPPECPICAEKYNKSNRIPIVCMYCSYTACATCAQTYILSEMTPKCMNTECNKEWTRHFMSRNFTKSFMKTKWRDHVANLQYEIEKSQLPRSQITLEMMREAENARTEVLHIQDQIDELRVKRNAVERRHYRLSNHIQRRMRGIFDDDDDNNTEGTHSEKTERRQFVRNCPAADCRGFLSQQWKCGLCNLWTCPECHEVVGVSRDTPHECKEENKESAKEIMKSTKPCPKCSAPIFRSEGCPQMWCTVCNSGFNWNTGKAYDTNRGIHNPHYFEYLRSQGNHRRINENLGGGCEGAYEWRDMTRRFLLDYNRSVDNAYRRNLSEHSTMRDCARTLSNIIQAINHIEDQNLRAFETEHADNERYRCDYLRHQMDENEFKYKLATVIKKRQKNDEYRQLFRMFVDASKDIVRRFGANFSKDNVSEHPVRLNGCVEELNALIAYCNAQSIDISETFDMENYIEIDNTALKLENYRTNSMLRAFKLETKKRPKTGRNKKPVDDGNTKMPVDDDTV